MENNALPKETMEVYNKITMPQGYLNNLIIAEVIRAIMNNCGDLPMGQAIRQVLKLK